MEHIDDLFPFQRVLSLAPLVSFWKRAAHDEAQVSAPLARLIVARLDEAPALHEPITDPAVLTRHHGLIELMMTVVFPSALGDRHAAAAFPPYHLESFFATPAFEAMKPLDRLHSPGRSKEKLREMALVKTMRAYHHILSHLYEIEAAFDRPTVFRSPDRDRKTPRYYQINFDPRFITVEKRGALKALPEEAQQRLLAEPTNLPLWKELLPPDNFYFHGFGIMSVTDVTPQEVLARLTRDLLQKDALTSPTKIDRLQNHLRTLISRPDLELGLVGLSRGDFHAIAGAYPVGRSLLLSSGTTPTCASKDESFYAQAFVQEDPVIVSDLDTCGRCTGFEKHLKELGVRSLMIAPLRIEGEIIGLLEVASPRPGAINALDALRIMEAAPLFATALQRSLDELENRLQAVIKRQYTALHPVVEWRFRAAALRYLEQQGEGKMVQPEPIVFRNVYPLYALSDVRDSSTHRNRAIQADLVEQLGTALAIIVEASAARPLPVLDEIGFRIGKFVAHVEAGLSSEHESASIEYLQQHVEPLFEQLARFSPAVQQKIEAYRAALDPALGIFYHQRKEFDESIQRITDLISAYLDEREEDGQRMYPHYFEKVKTDGVDYNIYVGASLLEDGAFDRLYLRNLRLWQLMVMCGVVWELRGLRHALPVPLDVTHLILVQDTPLSIRFRLEEKQFDVDGAYNARYEIVKKRIDKAVVLGSLERLTQPGKIAVVYSQPREQVEYRQYIEYLLSVGYLEGDVEELELENLQGVHGLKALRVSVREQAPHLEIDVAPTAIRRAVKAMEPALH